MQGEPTTPLKSPLLMVNKLVPHSENNQTPTGLKPWKNLNPFLYKIWTLFLFETLGMRLWVWPLEQTPVWWLKPIPSLNGLTQPISIWCCRLDSGWLSMLLHVLHPVVTCSPHLWQAKGAVRETAPCVSSRGISCISPRINGELACRLCLVNCDSKWCEAPKALCVVRFINLLRARMLHMLIAPRGRNSSCEYFYRSLGCLQLTLSSCDAECVAQWLRINFHL